jgi:cytochrome P450
MLSIPSSNPAEAQRILEANQERGWSMLVERYGKTFRHGGMVVTCEPEAVRAVLMERPNVAKRAQALKFLSLFPGARGVLFMDGHAWLARARALAPVFHRDNVTDAAGVVHDVASRHVRGWARAGRSADLYAAVQQLGMETAMRIGFGLDPEHPDTGALMSALIAYKNKSMDPRPSERFDVFHFDGAAISRCPHIAFRMWRDHGKVRRALRAALANGARSGRLNWISRLQEARLSRRALSDEVNHLYGAYNAIDYAVTWALAELGRRPVLAQTIRRELEETLGAREVPGFVDQEQMPTTNGFILEVFRRYPVSMGIVRALGQPLEIAGGTLPAGTQVLVLLHALHHHPDYWDDPWEIKPGRWASPNPRVPYSYVPFLLGGRKCSGRDMAEQHMRIVLAALVRRFDIEVFADPTVPPYMIPRFSLPIPFMLTPA